MGGRTFIKWRGNFRFLHKLPSGHPHQFLQPPFARHQCHTKLQHTHHYLGDNQEDVEFRGGLKNLHGFYQKKKSKYYTCLCEGEQKHPSFLWFGDEPAHWANGVSTQLYFYHLQEIHNQFVHIDRPLHFWIWHKI